MDEEEGCEICESRLSLSPAIWENDVSPQSEREILRYLHHFKNHRFTPEQKKYVMLGMYLSELLQHPDLNIRQEVRKIIAGWYGQIETQEVIQVDENQSTITTLEEVTQHTSGQEPTATADSAEGK